jgi:hypothetical protein
MLMKAKFKALYPTAIGTLLLKSVSEAGTINAPICMAMKPGMKNKKYVDRCSGVKYESASDMNRSFHQVGRPRHGNCASASR